MKSRPMMRRLAVCATLLLAACSRHSANPQIDAAVAAFDRDYAQMDRWRETLGGTIVGARETAPKDFRGRTIHDDADRWIFTADARREIKDLRDRAAASIYPVDANQLLEQARRRANQETARGQQIWRYWTAHLPAPYWRRYWHDLYAANGMADETPDSMLVSIESRISQSLGSGDFDAAGKAADELDAVFAESLSLATNRIFKEREAPASLAPRKTACPTERAAPQGEKPKLIRGESVESFYPQDALKRGETGSVVLRALIDPSGCATSVAIQVHSGVPALDAAALDWFESARFAPGSAQGKPIESTLVWKIRFELRGN